MLIDRFWSRWIRQALDPFLFKFRFGEHVAGRALEDIESHDHARQAVDKSLLHEVDPTIGETSDSTSTIKRVAVGGAELKKAGRKVGAIR